MAAPGFWNNQDSARGTIEEANKLKGWVGPWKQLAAQVTDIRAMADLLAEDDDADLAAELQQALASLEAGVEALELRTMLQGEDDHREAIVTIHPGAGGTESQDWAEMLVRMYTRWAERRGFQVNVLDLEPAQEAGIKRATIEIKGESAYGFLKAERGVHRLVRISPYDAQKRRHTSFASVFVYPQAGDGGEIEIKEGDLRIDTYRASGAGGQHVNKTESAVRITHLPSGLVVQCQNERSQHRNRDAAMKILTARLYSMRLEEDKEKRDALGGGKKEIAWGNQIRSYVFQPYTQVKDHRTDVVVTDVQAVMDGDLDPFIDAYLRMKERP